MKTFGRRLAVGFLLVLLCATALTEILLSRVVRRQRLAALEQRQTAVARLAATHSAALPIDRLPALAKQLSRDCDCRLTFIAVDGSVLADSSADAARMENHALRPEVASALAGKVGHSIRHSETVRAPFLYTAVPTPGRRGVTRAALSLAAVETELRKARQAVLGASLAGLAVALFGALAATRKLSRPVSEMADVAQRIAGGDYSARVSQGAPDELGRLAAILNELAARIAQTIQALEREHGRLGAILSSVVEGVAAVESSGALIAANPALRAILELREEDVGRPYTESLRQPRIVALLKETLKDGKPRFEELELLGPESRVFEAHTSALKAEGGLWGAIVVLHDITRLRRLENMRRDFVANVSHELRTPLASIKAFAETLREGAIDDTQHRLEFVDAIEKDAESLTALVDDLLDLSAIESGQRKPAISPVAVLEIARQACAGLRPLAQRRGVTLSVEETPGLPEVRADAGQLKQVFVNLIENAIKFNRHGGSVAVSAVVDAGRLRVQVADTGSGIPQADLPRVFERFYRVDKARSREMGGTGLGLSIVRHIVEAHHGSVAAQSRLGEGSTFIITLPL